MKSSENYSEHPLIRRLNELTQELAQTKDLHPKEILSPTQIKEIAQKLPSSPEELAQITDFEKFFDPYIALSLVYDYTEYSWVNHCNFVYKCPLNWDNFTPTDDHNVKYCKQCNENVYKVKSKKEYEQCSKEKKCIYVEEINTIGSTDLDWLLAKFEAQQNSN